MKWDKDNSLKLSILCVKLFALAMIAVVIFAPIIVKAIASINYLDTSINKFLISLYALCVPRTLALAGLFNLLKNIDDEKVFTEENVAILRGLSWCCMLASGICLVSGIFYYPFIFMCAVTGFVGLILRVVKNVFAQAVEIKNDNDFTI